MCDRERVDKVSMTCHAHTHNRTHNYCCGRTHRRETLLRFQNSVKNSFCSCQKQNSSTGNCNFLHCCNLGFTSDFYSELFPISEWKKSNNLCWGSTFRAVLVRNPKFDLCVQLDCWLIQTHDRYLGHKTPHAAYLNDGFWTGSTTKHQFHSCTFNMKHYSRDLWCDFMV